MLTKKTRSDIASCQDFVCLVTTEWCKSPTALEQLAYAQALGKPVIALVKRGAHIPPALTHVLSGCERHAWSSPKDLTVIMAMLESRHPGFQLVPGPTFD